MPIRGVHFDLKAHMLNFDAMCATARKMARLGYNTILLEYQDKFPFTGDLAPVAAPDALTAEQVQAFQSLCEELGLQIIPLIQSIGHMYFVLRHPQFSHLAEVGGRYENSTLCPSMEEGFLLVKEMMGQVLQAHPKCRYVHIGGDEASLSSTCSLCGETPKHELLAAHYSRCCDWILDQGKKPIMWSDMVLAHLETLDALRGKVVIMDWDYFTNGVPGEKPRIWGGYSAEHPEQWSELHKKLLRPYVYEVEPFLTRPFPYVQFLRDQGFEVLVAPAARCGGDAAYIPQVMHIGNCREAVRAAARANALGVVVTSWSVRRGPWPLTENSLIAAAVCMKNPGASNEETERAFALDHFGVEDAELAQIPMLLGRAALAADSVCCLSQMGLQHPFEDMGNVDDYADRKRQTGQTWLGNPEIAPAYAKLGEAAEAAQKLLNRAQPVTDEQKERVAFWQWSIDTAFLLSEYAPWLALTCIPKEKAEDLLWKFTELGARGDQLLSRWYTPYSMESDTMSRIGIHQSYLRQFL